YVAISFQESRRSSGGGGILLMTILKSSDAGPGIRFAPTRAKSRHAMQPLNLAIWPNTALGGTRSSGERWCMQLAWLLFVAAWMPQVRERGAALEAAHRWEEAA